MYYKNYLQFLSQMQSASAIDLQIEGCNIQIFIDTKKNLWKLSSVVYNGYGELSSFIEQSLGSLYRLNVESCGLYLKVCENAGTVTIYKDVKPVSGYILFKQMLQEFETPVLLWKQTLEEDALTEHLV